MSNQLTDEQYNIINQFFDMKKMPFEDFDSSIVNKPFTTNTAQVVRWLEETMSEIRHFITLDDDAKTVRLKIEAMLNLTISLNRVIITYNHLCETVPVFANDKSDI